VTWRRTDVAQDVSINARPLDSDQDRYAKALADRAESTATLARHLVLVVELAIAGSVLWAVVWAISKAVRAARG